MDQLPFDTHSETIRMDGRARAKAGTGHGVGRRGVFLPKEIDVVGIDRWVDVRIYGQKGGINAAVTLTRKEAIRLALALLRATT